MFSGLVLNDGRGLRVLRRARVLGPFLRRPVSLDPFCLLEEGTFGCVPDTAKKPGHGTEHRRLDVDGRRRFGAQPDVVWFDDLGGVDRPVFGGQDIPAVARQLCVSRGLLEALGYVRFKGSHARLSLP